MVMTPFYKDGVSALLFGLTGINEAFEAIVSGIVAIGGIYFTASYFKMHREMPKTWKLAIFAIITAYICSLIFLGTRTLFFFAASHILLIIALDIFVLSAIMLWKKSIYARFFAIAYGIPLIAAHEYFVSPYFAIPLFNVPLGFFKLGSVIEMIIFSYAITLQTKRLINKNNLLKIELIKYTQELKTLNKGIIERPDTTEELIKKFSLTIKEIEILKKLSLNMTNKEIANSQNISENTVKFHIKNICKKLEVNSKKGAKQRYLHTSKEEIIVS